MKKKCISFSILLVLLVGLIFLAIRTGSIELTYSQIFKGLFIEYNEDFATIYDLRFPRILVSIFAGAGLAVSGVMFQAVMKNSLADPGIIGISSGASFIAIVAIMLFPQLYFLSPLFGFFGGFLACGLVLSLSWKGGLTPLKVILVGVAVNAVFTGILGAIESMGGGSQSSVTAVVNAKIAQKTWADVAVMSKYICIGLLLAFVLAGHCNLLALEDKTLRSLGINVNKIRFYVCTVAVLLSSISTAIVGVVGFLGLIVPHIARLIVGNNHKVLIPFSMLLGSFIMLLADTVGRSIIAPYEIPVGICMAIIGGPFFILLIRRNGGSYES